MAEYTGEWWVPANPDLKIRGTLEIKNFYSILSFFQSVPSDKSYSYFKSLGGNLYNPDIILGNSEGKEITLIGCKGHKTGIVVKAGQPNSSINIPVYYPFAVFVGAHFAKRKDIGFKKLEISYQHMDEWTNIFEISRKYPKNTNNIIVEYKKPKAVKMYQDKRTSILIDFQPTESHSPNEIKISQKVFVRIEHLPKEGLFEKDLLIINYIKSFLAFGMNFPIYSYRVEGTTEKNKVIFKKMDGTFYPRINIFTSNMLESNKENKQLSSDEMLFSLKDIHPKIKDVINRWFETIKSPLKEAYNLYLGTLYAPSTYIRHNFLNLIQAFEAFYTASYPEEERLILPKEIYETNVHEKFIKTFNRDITPELKSEDIKENKIQELRENIDNKLEYGNEISLRKKLMQVMKSPQYKKLMSLAVKDRKEQKALAYKITLFRNDLSHGRKVTSNKLIVVKEKLHLLIKIILLEALGFEDEEIINFLKLNHS